MKKSWNGLLALGRSMAGLEGRAREYRVVDGGVPRFGESTPSQRKSTPSTAVESPFSPEPAPVPVPVTVPAATPASVPTPVPAPALHGLPPSADALSATAMPPTASPSVAAAGLPRGNSSRLPAPPARPVVNRSRGWRWFGWFRQRPVGHGKVEQIELRLEDVRPVRSSLEAEDFVVVNTPTTRPSKVRRNPFTDAVPQAPAPAPVVAEAPETAEAGRLNRLARWFRNREKTAHK